MHFVCNEADSITRNYFLDKNGVCFRTQVAIRSQVLSVCKWKKFMAGVFSEDEEEGAAVAKFLQNRILLPYEAEAKQALQYLEGIDDAVPPIAKKTLIDRWKQIRDVIQCALIHDLSGL